MAEDVESLLVFSIVKQRHKLSIDGVRLETEDKQKKHAKQVIEKFSWRVRKLIKSNFINLVRKRTEGDGDKFHLHA